MKIITVFIIITGIAFGNNEAESCHSLEAQPDYSTDDVSLTSLGTWALAGVNTARGIDCSDTTGELYITDYTEDKIFVFDYNGVPLYEITCPVEVSDILGVCLGTDYILINDSGSDTNINKYQTGIWNPEFANPVADPAGMDMDSSGVIWEIEAGSKTLYRMNMTGTVLNQWILTEPPPSAHAVACTVFPWEGTQIVLVGGITWSDFYFYEYNGVDLTFIGSHILPETANQCYGVAWCDQRNSFFWIYKQGANYTVCEFEAIITPVTLEQTTWGAIKANI